MGAVLHAKPRFGVSCTGCGVCCEVMPCDMVRSILNVSHGPCPALEREPSGEASCGMVKRPTWYMFKKELPEEETKWLSDRLQSMLGFGNGCRAEIKPVRILPRRD